MTEKLTDEAARDLTDLIEGILTAAIFGSDKPTMALIGLRAALNGFRRVLIQTMSVADLEAADCLSLHVESESGEDIRNLASILMERRGLRSRISPEATRLLINGANKCLEGLKAAFAGPFEMLLVLFLAQELAKAILKIQDPEAYEGTLLELQAAQLLLRPEGRCHPEPGRHVHVARW